MCLFTLTITVEQVGPCTRKLPGVGRSSGSRKVNVWTREPRTMRLPGAARSGLKLRSTAGP